jgi:lipopolysaccharide transport system ATP-binding protein
MNSQLQSGIVPKTAKDDDREVLVRVDNVSKKFCRDLKKSLWYGVKDVASELLPFSSNKEPGTKNTEPGLRPGEFWANKGISFELRRGECLGLIGRNGAGKTTLLKMLNGLIKPDYGTIEMHGRIGALIALGAGFNPILTGRENIYINASILGLSKSETDEKIGDIIDFSEIHEFIDTPVQSYSSGMQVRLGFAVATALNPDVLILDEVLAVGDAAFRAKCYRRILEIRKTAAVIFVTHSMEQIGRICDYTLVLNKGTIAFSGNAAGGVRAYEKVNEMGKDKDPSFVFVNGAVEEFTIMHIPDEMPMGGDIEMRMKAKMKGVHSNYKLRITIYSASGSVVAEVNESTRRFNYIFQEGENEFRITIPSVPLRVGKYDLGINLIDEHGDITAWSYKEHSLNVVGEHLGGNTDCQVPVTSWEAIREALPA